MRSLRSGCRGFSLIELMIVAVLILILSAMMYGRGSSNRQKQLKQECSHNLDKVYVAMQIYANDHFGYFPGLPGAKTSDEALDLLVPRYTADTSIFICPGSKDPTPPAAESIRNRKISYAYYMGRDLKTPAEPLMSDRQVDTASRPAGVPAFSTDGKPPGNNHHKYGGNFLFCDGAVIASPAAPTMSMTFTQGVVLLNPR